MSISKGVLFGAIGVIFASCLGTYKYQEHKYEALIIQHQMEAVKTLQNETEKLLERERKLANQIFELEARYNESQQELTDLDARYRQLVRDAGGLRDKGSGNCGDSSKRKDTSPSRTDEANPRVLSEEATDFLLRLTREADELRLRLLEAQEWAKLMMAQ